MPNKNFLLLSLDDSKIKKVSNVISNDSCRKILDYLSSKDATESELAEKLQIPISTVHYNLQQLVETGLVNANEFHYSKKGKEMSHYRLANKYIIISPKRTFGIKEKLKGILPVLLIVSGAAAIIQLFSSEMFAEHAVAQKALAAAPTALKESAQSASSNLYVIPQNLALWFLLGAIFALLVYFVMGLLRKDID